MSDGTDAGYTLQDIDDVIDQTPNRVDELKFTAYLDNLRGLPRDADESQQRALDRDPTYVPHTPRTVEGATRRHASALNLTPDQFREQANAYGISVDFFEESVGRQRIDPNEAMRQAAERGVVDFMSDEKRRIALRSRFIQELGRHRAQQDALTSGEEVPEELDILGGLRVSDQQAGFYGSGPGLISDDTLSDISQQGEAGYQLAAALSKDILDGEDIADQVEIWGRREQGWQSYVDYRTKKAMERRPGLSGQAREDAERRAQRRAVQEIALFKTVGLWTAPVFVPYDLTEGGEVNLRQADDMGFMDAIMPNIEVIGIKEDSRSGRLETVTRQTGPWQYAFDMADLMQSGAAGLISKKEGESLREATIRGIANRRNMFEFGIDSDIAEASLPGAIAAGGAGFLAAVAFPDLFVGFGAAKLLPRVAGLIGQRKTMVQAAELLRVTAVESAHGSAALKRLMETDADGTLSVTPGSAEAQDLAADVVARYNAATEAEQALARLSPEISRNLNAADAGVAASFNTVAENADMTLKAARAIDRDLPPTVRRLITAHPAARKGAAEFTAVTEVGDSAAQLLRTEQFNSAEHFEKLIQIRDALQKALTNPDPVKRADEVTKALGRLDAGAVRSEMERVISKGMLDDATARAELRVGQEVDAKALDGLTEDALDDFRRIVREGNTWDTEEGIAAFKQKALDWIAGADLDDVAKDLVTTYTKHIEDHAKHLIGSELDLEKAVVALKRAISSIAPNREARAVAAALVREELMRRLLKKATPIETLTPLREKYWDVTKISTDAKAFAARLQKQLKLDRQQALFLASVFDRRATAWGAAENQDSRRFWDRIAKVFGRKKPEADDVPDGPDGTKPDGGVGPDGGPTVSSDKKPLTQTKRDQIRDAAERDLGDISEEMKAKVIDARMRLATLVRDNIPGGQYVDNYVLVRVKKDGDWRNTPSVGAPLFWVKTIDQSGNLTSLLNPKSTSGHPLNPMKDPGKYLDTWVKSKGWEAADTYLDNVYGALTKAQQQAIKAANTVLQAAKAAGLDVSGFDFRQIADDSDQIQWRMVRVFDGVEGAVDIEPNSDPTKLAEALVAKLTREVAKPEPTPLPLIPEDVQAGLATFFEVAPLPWQPPSILELVDFRGKARDVVPSYVHAAKSTSDNPLYTIALTFKLGGNEVTRVVRSITPTSNMDAAKTQLKELMRADYLTTTGSMGDSSPPLGSAVAAASARRVAKVEGEFEYGFDVIEGETFLRTILSRVDTSDAVKATHSESKFSDADHVFMGTVGEVVDALLEVGDARHVGILKLLRPFIDDSMPFVLWDTKTHVARLAPKTQVSNQRSVRRRDLTAERQIIADKYGVPGGPLEDLTPASVNITGRGYRVTGASEQVIVHEILHAASDYALSAAAFAARDSEFGKIFTEFEQIHTRVRAALREKLDDAKLKYDDAVSRGEDTEYLWTRYQRLISASAYMTQQGALAGGAHPRKVAKYPRGERGRSWRLRRGIHETIAMMYTEPIVQEVMKEIKLPKKPGEKWRTKDGNTLWDKFVGVVAKIFKVKEEDRTLLAHAMAAHGKLMRQYVTELQTARGADAAVKPEDVPWLIPDTSDGLAVHTQRKNRGLVPPAAGTPKPVLSAVEDASAAGAKTVDEVEEARRLWEEEGVESRFFKAWFGASKIVDEAGQPLVVYHGTAADFDEFDPAQSVAGRLTNEYGIYTTPREQYAKQYATWAAEGDSPGKTLPLYLSIRNPLIVEGKDVISPRDLTKVDIDKLKARGYDGIVVVSAGKPISQASEIVAFEPTQIKSQFNRGTFARDEPRIQMSAVEEPPLPQTPEEIKKAFYEMGRIQRGAPESQMVQVRYRDGIGGPISYLTEHIGDLTHRMSDSAFRSIKTKLERTYNALPTQTRTPDGQVRFGMPGLKAATNDEAFHKVLIDEGYRRHVMQANAPDNPIPLKTREKFAADIEAQMSLYAQEHRKIPVYNEVQRLANDAAIAIGERRYIDARDSMAQLQRYIDEGKDAFRTRMESVEPEFARPLMMAVEEAPPQPAALWYSRLTAAAERLPRKINPVAAETVVTDAEPPRPIIDRKTGQPVIDPATQQPRMTRGKPGRTVQKPARTVKDIVLDSLGIRQQEGTLIYPEGIKKSEVEWSGLLPWLDEQVAAGRAISREEVLTFLRSNELRVDEVIAGADTTGQKALKAQMSKIKDAIEKASPTSPPRSMATADYHRFMADPEHYVNEVLFNNAIFAFDNTDPVLSEVVIPPKESVLRMLGRAGLTEGFTPAQKDAAYNAWMRLFEKDLRDIDKAPATVDEHNKLLRDFIASTRLRDFDAADLFRHTPAQPLVEFLQADAFLQTPQMQEYARLKRAYNEVAGDKPTTVYEDFVYERPSKKGNIHGYREVLITLPSKAQDEAKFTGKQGSHWKKTDDVLAHLRTTDRIDDEGNKVLFVDEIQSDWHQLGRKLGYSPEERAQKLAKAEADLKQARKDADELFGDGYRDRADEEAFLEPFEELVSDLKKRPPIPEAPYKGTEEWAGLAIRRIIRMAADEGYDRVAFTPWQLPTESVGMPKESAEHFYGKIVPKVVAKFVNQWDVKPELILGTGDQGWAARSFPALAVGLRPMRAEIRETPMPLMAAVEPPPPAVPREAIQILEDGRAIIRALTDEPNPEIVIRTLGRLMLQDLNTQELAQVQTWLKTKGINTEIKNGRFVNPKAEEEFEDAFAEYIREYTPATGPFVGPVAATADIPAGAFARLKNAVASVMASADPQTVPEDVRPLFEKMLGGGVPARGQLLPTVKKIIQKNLLGIIAKDAPKAINRIAREAQRLGLKDISGDALTSQFDATGSVTFKQPLFAKQDVDSKEWTLAQVRDDQGNLVDIGNWDGETFTLTKDDVRRLQLLIDDEQLLLVGQQTPQLVVDSIAQGVEEQSMTERLRQITQGSGRLRQFGRIATFTLFGDDALLDLRMFPPQARQNILAIMRPIQQVIGDAITIASENDLKRNAQFLGGELVAFEKGRPALSSGADYGGLALRIIESAFDRLDLADQRKLKLAALLTKSTSKDAFNDWGGAFASVNKAGGLNSAYTAAFDKSANMDALKALVDDFMGVTTDGGTLLTEDLSLALGLDVRDPKRILTVFEIFLYHAGQSERIIDGAVRSYDMAQTSQARMLSLFTELKEAGFADNVLNHASVVMAGHGAAERSRALAARMGLMVNETVYKFYRAMAHGHDVPIKYRAQVEELASKIGMNWLPEYMSNPGPFDGYYVPTVMRERMMDALARVNIKVEKRAARLGSEDTMRGASAVFYTYMKTRVTRGAIFLRQKYFTMNTFDHFFQLAQNQGLLPAIVSVVRVAAQDLLVLPGIARTIYLFQKGDLTDEKAIERVRSALQAGGDKAAHAAGNFLGVSKYNLHINPVMEGADELIKVGNTYYRPSDLRRIAVEEGIFASFDTRALERNIKRQTVELFDTAAAQGASNVRDGLDDIMGMTSDIAEAWSERERLGAMITLIESGMPPRMAARMTVEALYDYAGSMGKLDRLWLINMVLPFWAFQKNANKQVFDAIFSPWGAYRLGVLRRAQEYGPEYLSHIVYSAVTDPYGVDISALEPDAEANYWALRNTIENGWGPLEGLDDDSRRLLENQVGPLEDLSVEDREFLENGYGGLENVPTQVKSAMKMLFRDRGIIVDDGEVMSLSSRLLRAKQQFVMGTASSVIPEAQRSGRASYRVNMPAVAIPIRRTEMVKKYYATMLQQNPEHGFVELFLPESTIYAGMRHMSGVAALMILGASGVVDTAESGLDLVFGEGDDEMPEPSGRMSYTQAAVNLTEEIFPVERGLMLRYLWPYIGIGDAAPTPVHPALGSMIKTEFGIDLLTVPAVRDPFAAQFAETLGISPEIAEQLSTAKQQREYLLSGPWSMFFENAGLGELNRIMWQMEGMRIGDTALAPATRRLPIEYVSPEAAMAAWARRILGVDVVTTMPSETARREEPGRTMFTRLPPSE